MANTKFSGLALKLGNLFLAIVLAIVPTLITYIAFGLYGLTVCRNMQSSNIEVITDSIYGLCNQTVWSTNNSWIILIGFFITLPTWYWFYYNMKRKK